MPSSPVKRVPAARRTATKAAPKSKPKPQPLGQKSLESYIAHQSMKRPASSPTVTPPDTVSTLVDTTSVKRQKNNTNVSIIDASTGNHHHGDSSTPTTASGILCHTVTDPDVHSPRSHQFLILD